MKRKLNHNYKFLIYAIILIIIKQLLVGNLPIYAIGHSICDDELMVRLQLNILQLKWLGPFTSLTLVKGVVFPMFLALSSIVGISYLNAVSLVYSVSCLVFIYCIKDIIKNKKWLYIIFIVLLFNPITYDFSVTQRVYRNSLIPSQVLLIFSYIFYLFIHRKSGNKNLLICSILGGISLWSFYNTREDSIWIIPLVVVFTIIILLDYILDNKKDIKIKKIGIFVLPFIILILGNQLICLLNYKYYGVYTRVDEDKTAFAQAMQTIYSVPNKKEIKYVSVTRDKLNKIYEYSPSMAKIRNELNSNIDDIEKTDRNPGDHEIEDGWFWWAFRFAVEDAGYYKDAKEADKFYKGVTKEIRLAQKQGKLKKQNTMPSALMSPWRKGYTAKLINAIGKEIVFTNSFDTVGASDEVSTGKYVNTTLFEVATNDDAIVIDQQHYIDGWYYYHSDDYRIEISDKKGKVYNIINCSKDEKCDINFDLTQVDNAKDLIINIIDGSNKTIETLNLNSNLKYSDNDSRQYSFNNYSLNNILKYEKKVKKYYVTRVNIIANIYKVLGLFISIIGFVSYLIYTYISIRKKNLKVLYNWLIPTSILLTYLLLLLGVGYNEISSCASITSLYLVGSYQLIIMFNVISIILTFEYMLEKKLS